jgi:NADP-dependent 3-hydroxy acid dehydrogenase YdfG
MLAQALEANGAVVYILGRRQEMLEKAAATAVRDPSLRSRISDDNIFSRSMAISTRSRQT